MTHSGLIMLGRFKVDFSIGGPTDNRRKQLKTVPFIVTSKCIYLFAGKKIDCQNGQRHMIRLETLVNVSIQRFLNVCAKTSSNRFQ